MRLNYCPVKSIKEDISSKFEESTFLFLPLVAPSSLYFTTTITKIVLWLFLLFIMSVCNY